jgi:hypothetical protein
MGFGIGIGWKYWYWLRNHTLHGHDVDEALQLHFPLVRSIRPVHGKTVQAKRFGEWKMLESWRAQHRTTNRSGQGKGAGESEAVPVDGSVMDQAAGRAHEG